MKKIIPSKKLAMNFLKIAIPAIIAQLLLISINFVDNFMVGNYGNATNSLASIMIGNEITFFGFGIIFATANVFHIFLSQFFGANMKNKFHETQKIFLLINVSLTSGFALIMAIFPENLVQFFETDVQIVQMAASYIKIMALGILMISITFVFLSGLLTIGKTNWLILISFISLILNIILDYLLIYIADLGIQGASIATVIALFIELIVVISISFKYKKWLIFSINIFKINKKIFKSIVSKSFAFFGQWAFISSLVLLSIIWSRSYGKEVQAGLASGYAISNIIFAIFPGIASAVKVIIGHKLGASKFNQAWNDSLQMISLVILSTIFFALIGIASAFFAPQLSGAKGITIYYAKWIILIYSFSLILYTIPTFLFSCLEIGGKTTVVAIFKNFFQLIIVIPTAILCILILKIEFKYSLLISQIVQIIIVAISTTFYLRKKWLQNITIKHR